MTQTATFSATSKAGTTRKVIASVEDGKVYGIFVRTESSGGDRVSPVLPIKGELDTLATFATRQPGLFAMWVDAKFEVQ
jgi:hypothetical protein